MATPMELDLGLPPASPRRTPAAANTTNRRWPLSDLLRVADVDAARLAEVLHVDQTTVYRRMVWGLTDDESDTWAVAVAMHPVWVWGYEWAEAHLGDPETPSLLEDL